ncbi:MAG: NUDIX hydrolase [Acidobacteriota bacterium]|nr:NUDIX hydrolase [Acidobacteriota bacterium]
MAQKVALKKSAKSSKTAASTTKPVAAKKSARPRKVKVLSSETVFTSRVFRLTTDEIIEPSGIKVRRDVIRHPGSVVILGIDESAKEPRVLLIQQYRYTANEELWELPAGRIDEGEDALTAAKRELEEETGYAAHEWIPALVYYASPGFVDETMTVFAARDLRKGTARPEEDEFITSHLVPLKKAVQWVMSGKIHDGKAIAGILWAAQKFHITGKSFD